MTAACKICSNQNNNNHHTAREMMFGFRDEFSYIECSGCGCLQIAYPPDNLEKYYSTEYFAFTRVELPPDKLLSRYFLDQWIKYGLQGKSLTGMLISKFKPVPLLYEVFRKYNIHHNSKVLDVGCGNGTFLMNLHRAGFNNLLGVDPYLNSDICYDNRLQLLKMGLHAVDEKFDIITLNHSFEHMAEPFKALHHLYNLLNEKGLLIIRIPMLGYAWRHYGINWVQLDAPRHFFLHTIKSIQTVFKRARLELIEYAYDSDEFQFWGSEQYLKNIPLMDNKSFWISPHESLFSKSDITSFKLKAITLNNQNDGDQASFYLRKEQQF